MSSGYFGQSDQMEHRQLNREFGNIVKSSSPILEMEREQGKLLGADQLGLQTDFATNAQTLYPELATAEREASAKQRQMDLVDLRQLGKGYQKALGRVAPGWQESLKLINDEARGATERSPLLGDLNVAGREAIGTARSLNPSRIREMLERSAIDNLNLGRNISPEELREVVQASRAAYGDRGMMHGNQSMIAEVLARDRFGTEREAQRAAFAGQVAQLARGEDESLVNRAMQLGNFGGNVEQLNQAGQAQGQNFMINAAGVQQNALSPVLGFFGRTGVAPTAGGQLLGASPNIIGAGGQSIGSVLGYGSDLENTNFNADAATKISNANNMAAIHGAIIGAVGQMAGGAMAACWVAREIYGGEMARTAAGTRYKWEIFRDWLTMRAPRWFYRLYLKHGKRFAEWLSKHPCASATLRPWFERRVRKEIEQSARAAQLRPNYQATR